MASSVAATTSSALKQVKQWKCFGGLIQKFEHQSVSTKTQMTFSVFLPSKVLEKASATSAVVADKVPAIYWLSGLTCSDDNFVQKAGAFKCAADENVAIICPDTSPRGAGVDGEDDNWDFGSGAGFYVNATQEPWKTNYQMYDYVTKELPALCESALPITTQKSITGHSMGGHGALTIFLKNPDVYTSCSAFSPICHPIACPWGQKAFSGYLGDAGGDIEKQVEMWREYDASELLRAYKGRATKILIDQGDADDFLVQKQLLPESMTEAAQASSADVEVEVRMQPGYDHSYFFISSFIDDHIRFHSAALKK